MDPRQEQLAMQFLKRLEGLMIAGREEVLRELADLPPDQSKLITHGLDIGMSLMRNVWIDLLDDICPECKKLAREEVIRELAAAKSADKPQEIQ